MIATASEFAFPLDEPQIVARRKRIAHLAGIVFELMKERDQGGTNHEFDNDEDPGLIAALRACSLYTNQIGSLNFNETLFAVEIEGVDGQPYLIRFSIAGPGIIVYGARVGLAESEPNVSEVRITHTNFDVMPGYSTRLKLGGTSTDQAFLVGMSLVIGFMDDRGDDEEDDARLAPLLARVMPTNEELRQIRAELPDSFINYDEEGELPC